MHVCVWVEVEKNADHRRLFAGAFGRLLVVRVEVLRVFPCPNR
jgi:hypothetical protein